MLEWFLKILLNVLLKRAEKLARSAYAEHEESKKRGEVNAENLASYNAAKDRAEKIKASVDLLNGTHSS
jgi:hypothetical protein